MRGRAAPREGDIAYEQIRREYAVLNSGMFYKGPGISTKVRDLLSETGSLVTASSSGGQERTVARANECALKPGTWPVWLGEAPTDVAQLELLLAPDPSEKMIC